MEEETKSLNCRFYKQKYPEVDDLVLVRVQSIADMGAYVTLLEYDNIEGMVLLSELSRRRVRSVSKLIRVGKTEVCVVLRVDKVKGYIDLSKRRAAAEDIEKCNAKFNKSKTVHSIMRYLAETTDNDLKELNESIAWPLYKKFGHAYDAFKLILTNEESVFDGINFPNEDIRNKLISIVQQRMKPQPVKIRSDIDVICYTYEGIDAIKKALKAGEALGTDIAPVKISLVAPPTYVVVTTSPEKTYGINLLKSVIEKIEEVVKEYGGVMKVKAAPRVVSARDDHTLSVLLEQLKEENKEVDGDEDYEEA